jgi:thermitase
MCYHAKINALTVVNALPMSSWKQTSNRSLHGFFTLEGKVMRLKVITGILLLLLLTNIVATFNVTSIFAFFNNSPKIENTADALLKNIDVNGTLKDALNFTNTGYSNLWDFGGENQTNNKLGSWGTNSTEVVVGLAGTYGAYAKVEQMALMENGQMVNKVSMGGKVDAVVVDVPSGSVASFVTEVKENGLSKYVEPSVEYQAFMVPNDPYWSLQWGPQMIQADYAWNTTTGSKTVLVCVVDTGIDYNHPDLKANYVSLGYNWVSNSSDVLDDNGHGTHCAGIIGAVMNNGVGIAGLAQVKIMAEKGLNATGYGNDYNLANAIINATDAGANIISMSWGSNSPSKVIEDALKYAYTHGVLLVAAAGNSGSSTKLYPAAYSDVIAVTATDPTDHVANFSSYGDWVELAAPGVDIYSTTPTYPVTLTDEGVATINYSYLSGTSMACPHVAGVAALIWSEFPSMSRDALRLHLRDTADDLGPPGFDVYYGYGRVNAKRAVTEPLPAHDIVIGNFEKPLYVEPSKIGMINATVINYGSNNETNVTVQWLANSSVVQSNLTNMTSEASTDVSLSWTPTIVGNYNVTVYALPVVGETNTANNVVQGYVYVGIPLKVFVLRSAGTELVTDAWDALNNNWQEFGSQFIYIDYTTLDKDNITYSDLKATAADVLIISCAFMWEYSDSEIAAIERYVYEGHGFIATAGTFSYNVPNNTKFAPLLGINGSNPNWNEASTDLLDLLQPAHPLFAGVPNPYTMPSVGTALPYDGAWSSNELAGGTYVALGRFNESAIVTYRGLVYISPWLEEIPDYYKFNLQILYNAMIWSKYQKPQHDLVASMQAPAFVSPNSTIILNATVTNEGVQNESNVNFSLSLVGKTLAFNETLFQLIPLLQSGKNYTMSLLWNQTLEGVYNITAYASPVPGEADVTNNEITISCLVAPPLIQPQEGQWASYKIEMNITGQQTGLGTMLLNYSKYVSPYLMNVTLLESIYSGYPSNMTQMAWTTVNIFNRYCEEGVWSGYWFPGLIETNITVGSSVNVLNGPSTVIGSEALVIGTKIADCWKLLQNYPGEGNYTWWYDKTNGLWMKMLATFSLSGSMALNEVIMLDNTNIPTGYTPAHELQVTVEAPNFLFLGNSTMLNATVFNYGLNNETNVELALEINGTTVELLSVPKLAVNDSYTTSYPWTPSNEAIYNITAYAQPVPGENITSDNTATVMVNTVMVKGYVLFDQTHITNSVDIYSTWITNLRNEGYIVNLYNNSTGSITSTVLERYDAFVTINARLSYSDAELNAIKEFVDKGGGLLVIGDDYPDIYTNLTAFAGITWTFAQYVFGGYTTNITPHEVTQGVSQVYLSGPTAMINLNASAQALVSDNYMGHTVLAVNWHGPGRVMGFADQYSLSNYFIGFADNLRLATNMIAWLCEKDTTPPQILLISPSNGTLIGTTSATINWTAIDSQSGIDKYSIYRNGQLLENITDGQFVSNGTIQSYTESYIVPNLIEGSNNVTIVAYDKAENHAKAEVTITVDRTLPTLEILTPANNSYVKRAVMINVSSSDAHFNHMELYVDANKVASFNTSGVHTYLWNTSSESYSAHRITLTGVDIVGNSASTTITVTVDNVPPTVSITSPANNTFVRGNITITFVAQDLALKNTSLICYNGTWSTIITTQPFDTTHALLSDGNYTVKLVAFDWAGNKAEVSINISIDNTKPTANIAYPASNSYIKGTVNVNCTLADSKLENATLLLDGQFVANVTLTTSYAWNTTVSSDGSHRLILSVLDKAGNMATAQVTVVVDNHSPSGEILAPSNGAYVGGTVNVTCYGNDLNLDQMKLYIDGINMPLYNWTTSGMHTTAWDTTKYSDGTHTISLVVHDKAANQFITTTSVTVDNTPPAISIISPQNSTATSLTGTVNITFSATDSNKLGTLLLFIDYMQTTINANQVYKWDTTKVVDGTHTIRIVATDVAGNTEMQTITVKTANAEPAYMTYIGYALTAILGLILGALAVWTLLKRRPIASKPAT